MATSPRIEELRKKFDENPRRYFAPLANEYRKVGDFDQAIFICQEYLPQQPGHMSGHIVYGQALFEAKRFAEAKTVFETALTLDPENLIALRHLGDISREMGDMAGAKSWYDRVLQADPRNEEIGAIMATMNAGAAAPAAPAPETPKAAEPPHVAGSPSAPTMELSAAMVQEMANARRAAQAAAAPAASAPASATLDDAMTIEQIPVPTTPALEGLEPTSHSGPIDAPAQSILDAPVTPAALDAQPASILDPAPTTSDMMDIPAGGMLGLEPTSMGAEPEPAPTASSNLSAPTLDEIAIELPPAAPAPAAEMPAIPEDEMLDLEPIELDVPAAPAPSAAPAAGTPIDGGHDGLMDLDIDLPAATPAKGPSKPLDSVPTLVMEAIKETAAPVLDAVEQAVPAIIDVVQEASGAVVEAATSMPTIVMDAISVPTTPPKAPAPSGPPAEKAAPFVTETMAQLYLEQGHRDKALEIYRQLIAAKPQDAELKKRLEAIERAPAAAQPVSTPTPPAETAKPAVAPSGRFKTAGRNVRLVLRELLGIEASATHSNGNGAAHAANGERGSIDTLFSTDAAEEMSPLAAAFDGGYVAPPGSIDAVFTG